MNSYINFEISKLINLANKTNITIARTTITDYDKILIKKLIKSVLGVKN